MYEQRDLIGILDALVGAGIRNKDIADKLGVVSAAVSNWKQRVLAEETRNGIIDKLKEAYPIRRKESGEWVYEGQQTISVVERFTYTDLADRLKQGGVDTLRLLDSWYNISSDRGRTFADLCKCVRKTIQILILSPDSHAAALRHKTLSDKLGHSDKVHDIILRNIEVFLKEVAAATARGLHIEVRHYDELPALQLAFLDDELYYGFFLSTGVSTDSPFNHVKGADKSIFKYFDGHFNAVWERATPVDDGEFKRLGEVAKKLRQKKSEPDFEKFLGVYGPGPLWHFSVYYPEMSSQNEEYRHKHLYANHIGQGHLRIRKASSGFKAEFTASDKTEFLGEVRVEQSGGFDYLSISMESPGENPIPLHFLLRLRNKAEGLLYGTYNVVYRNGTIGAGLLVFSYAPEGQVKVGSEDPLDFKDTTLPLAHLARRFYVSAVTRDMLKQNEEREKRGESVRGFAGLYEVYSYGRTHNAKQLASRCVTKGYLRIHPLGFAELHSALSAGKTLRSDGFARCKGKTLYIEFKSRNPANANSLLGEFIVKGNGGHNEGDILVGVFAGLDSRRSQPIAKRIILRYKAPYPNASEPPALPQAESHEIFTEGFRALDSAITDLLLGSTRNFVGFARGESITNRRDLERLKREEHEVPPVEIFKMAMLHILQKDKADRGDLQLLRHLAKKYYFHGGADAKALFEVADAESVSDEAFFSLAKKIFLAT